MCSWYKCKFFSDKYFLAINIRKRVNFDSVKGRFSGLVKVRIKRNVFSLMLYQLCLLLKIGTKSNDWPKLTGRI